MMDGNGGVRFEQVEGYTFEMQGLQFGVTKTGSSNFWQVTDLVTGTKVGQPSESRKNAVEKLAQNLEKITLEVFKEKQVEFVKTYINKGKTSDEIIEEYKQEQEIKEEAPQLEAPKEEEEEIKEEPKVEEKTKKKWNIGVFFKGIANLEELKKAFKKFAKWLHPDVSDYENANEAFIALQEQYEKAEKLIKQGKVVEAEKTVNVDIPQELKDIINKINHLEGIEIKVRGTWLWVAGVGKKDLDKHKVLKEHGLRFGSNANEWYYAMETVGAKKKKGAGYNAEQLTEKWGEIKVKASQREKLDGKVAENKNKYSKRGK